MPINTRAKRREPVEAFAEYSVNDATENKIKLTMPAAVRSDANKPMTVKSNLLDISVIGCAIDSPYLIPPGVILDIKIDSAPFTVVTGDEAKPQIVVVGLVRSCTMKSQGHYRLGVKFNEIAKEDEKLIEDFIKIKERRQAPRWDMTK